MFRQTQSPVYTRTTFRRRWKSEQDSKTRAKEKQQLAKIDWAKAAEKAEDLNRIFQATLQHAKGEDGTAPIEWEDITNTAQAIMEQWAPDEGLRPKKPYISEETWTLIKHRDQEMCFV